MAHKILLEEIRFIMFKTSDVKVIDYHRNKTLWVGAWYHEYCELDEYWEWHVENIGSDKSYTIIQISEPDL